MDMPTRTRRARAEQDHGPVPATDTPEGRKEFKERASAILGQAATDQGLCATVDQILAEVGLKPRQNYVDSMLEDARYRVNRSRGANPYVKIEVVEHELVGEDDDEAFNAWRAATAKRLYQEAERHGLNGATEHLANAGFEGPADVQIVIEGTFRLTRDVKRYGDENLIDAIDAYQVRDQLYERFNTDDVQWKATVADSEGS